jgi:hypothetical protein
MLISKVNYQKDLLFISIDLSLNKSMIIINLIVNIESTERKIRLEDVLKVMIDVSNIFTPP